MRILSTSVLSLFLIVPTLSHAKSECQRQVEVFEKMAILINEGMIRESGGTDRYIYANRKENTEGQTAHITKSYGKAALDMALSSLEAYKTKACEGDKEAGMYDGTSNTTNCNSIAFWVDHLEFDSAAVQKDFYEAIREMWLLSGGVEDPDKRSWYNCQLDVKQLEVDRVRKR